jgi:hypothetical protein
MPSMMTAPGCSRVGGGEWVGKKVNENVASKRTAQLFSIAVEPPKEEEERRFYSGGGLVFSVDYACHMRRRMHACHMRRACFQCRLCMSYEEEDACMSYEEEGLFSV